MRFPRTSNSLYGKCCPLVEGRSDIHAAASDNRPLEQAGSDSVESATLLKGRLG